MSGVSSFDPLRVTYYPATYLRSLTVHIFTLIHKQTKYAMLE